MNHNPQPQQQHQQPSSSDSSSTTNSTTTTSSSATTTITSSLDKYDSLTAEMNVGYDKWCAIRQLWTTPSTEQPSTSLQQQEMSEVDVQDVVEHLVSGKQVPLSKPVPLNEMVNILLEIWEADGLFD